jgi:2-pyrone-4,6-dicarboxylate lactonase
VNTTKQCKSWEVAAGILPAGACDCHVHVYGPFDEFPIPATSPFHPTSGTIDALEQLWHRFGIDRGVLVQGAAYGQDHEALLAAIRRAPQNRRGVGLLTADTSMATLERLKAGGVCGARINFVRHLGKGFDEEIFWQTVGRLEALSWHLEVHVDPDDLVCLDPFVRQSPVPIVIDHMGRINAAFGVGQAPFQVLLKLVRHPNCWVKLSGADRLTKRGDLETAVSFARKLLQAAPNRVVWGSDWPHVNSASTPSDEALFQLLPRIAPNNISLAQLLVGNPARLYGFVP